MLARLPKYTVAVFGCLIALLVVLCAFFADNRHTDIDELALYNPAYMVAHYSRLTYPAEGYFNQPMIVHPPVHTGFMGLLARLGATWYYAEGGPVAMFLLLAVWTVVRGKFPPPVQLGLLFGVGLLMTKGDTIATCFGSRPEGAVHSAWFAALLLLESARLDDWDPAKFFGGAFLLTWASSLHYYATPAIAGLGVYAAWAIASLGWNRARARVFAMTGGALLFAVPYVALYLAPNWSAVVKAIRYHQAGADLSLTSLSPTAQHFALYRAWSAAAYLPLVLRLVLGLGAPLMLLSALLLGSIKATRGIAMASLPLQLGIFFFASHKPGVYLLHEVALFGAALAVGVLVLAVRRPVAMPVAGAILLLYLAPGIPPLRASQVHPVDLARAATRQILGPNARVISRPGAWYSGGAAAWHDYHFDLIGPESSAFDPRRYLENFDAAVDYPFRSGYDVDNPERKTLSRWYADGLLKLRGFYFAEQEGDLRLVLLSLKRPPAITGFAVKGGRVLRFDESTSGDYEVISAACPAIPEVRSASALAILNLPQSGVMVTVLSKVSPPEPLAPSCMMIQRATGRLTVVDRDALVASLRRVDAPIRFYPHVEDLPGFRGVGIPADALPPAGASPLPGVVSLAELEPADPSARVVDSVVTTPAARGGFGAHLPIHSAEPILFPHWAQFRLKVLAGRIALAAIAYDGAILARSGMLLASPEPIEVALKTPPNTADVVFFNAGDSGPARVQIDDAVAVASPAGRTMVQTGPPPDLRPPSGTRRLDRMLQLAEVQPAAAGARIERLPDLRVTTPPSRGDFAATLPLHSAVQVPGVSWIQLRLRVLSGRVGFALAGGKGEIVVRTNSFVLPSAEPVDVALRVEALGRGSNVVVFNENLASPSCVEILDAAVMVPRQ